MGNDLFNKTQEYVQPDKVDEWGSFVAKNRRIIGEGYKYGQMAVYMKILCENKRPSYGYLCRILSKKPDEALFYGKVLSEYVKDGLGVGFANYLIEKGGLTAEFKAELQKHLARLEEENASLSEKANVETQAEETEIQ